LDTSLESSTHGNTRNTDRSRPEPLQRVPLVSSLTYWVVGEKKTGWTLKRKALFSTPPKTAPSCGAWLCWPHKEEKSVHLSRLESERTPEPSQARANGPQASEAPAAENHMHLGSLEQNKTPQRERGWPSVQTPVWESSAVLLCSRSQPGTGGNSSKINPRTRPLWKRCPSATLARSAC